MERKSGYYWVWRHGKQNPEIGIFINNAWHIPGIYLLLNDSHLKKVGEPIPTNEDLKEMRESVQIIKDAIDANMNHLAFYQMADVAAEAGNNNWLSRLRKLVKQL